MRKRKLEAEKIGRKTERKKKTNGWGRGRREKGGVKSGSQVKNKGG